ncbi:efflux RND transporter periplasmic adaptor subunit [Halieaceae bacterium IMCC11814]|uniref:Efflux RND transporter periplasmic adaptor subunit n=2 Tax=Candidatus Marimicrobium litorale TaxID=2518991 RepID=A0ABT3TCG2_9GAMM|nr:efflux RND transporter periplasmic adaptor subunit [Candidatus Marimicrobium litorale]
MMHHTKPGNWLAVLTVLLTACGDSDTLKAPVPEIAVVKVVERDTPITQDFVGQTRGSTDIPIRARVEGFLESRNFREGGEVTQGQLLYTIDPLPFKAKVFEAEGRLAEARTKLAKAKADLDRIEPLAKMNAVSQQDLDGAVAQRDAAEGSVKAAEAQLDLANIELGYTRIQSPIDGIIGISEAEVGEVVGSNPDTFILNYVSLTDPIRVRFSINERDFLRLSRSLAKERRMGKDQRDESERPDVTMILADGSVHEQFGRVIASDASINPQTGTFKLEADFPNPDSIVIAGQFARVRIVIDDRKNALLIPQRALSELQGNFRVFVVNADGTVTLRAVEPGPQVGQLTVINSGLQAGEEVAIEGLLRLGDGLVVKPRVVEFPETPGAIDKPGA